MIKHVLKIIWAQRRNNGWIFAELFIVACALWYVADRLYVDVITWNTPLGYDIENTWRFKLMKLGPSSPSFVPESEYASDQTADLLKLMEQIRLHPAVEEVCVTYYSCPYSGGNSWGNPFPVDEDTAGFSTHKSLQIRRVSPEYFDVFRVKDLQGRSLTSTIKKAEVIDRQVIITEDLEALFFKGKSAYGRKLRYDNSEVDVPVLAVSCPVRADEYSKSEPALYELLVGERMEESVNDLGAENAELCVRMKRQLSKDEINSLLEETSERLTVNNLNVYGVMPVAGLRDLRISQRNAGQCKQLSLAVFLLVNAFFGIVGTFWLRTRQRRGETGLRIALGANRFRLKEYFFSEGVLLLLLTVPLSLVFVANMIAADIPDTYRLSNTAGRFIVSFGGIYLLMALMIVAGIRLSIQKAMAMTPAEALHHE
ncbi:MAG: multidrug ABC transporter substrate-binding protein [Tannerella sp.]|jgi:hypothetical protein|nr:multidrug ABC transporter substrate-binding protein [Tannerella sp.]